MGCKKQLSSGLGTGGINYRTACRCKGQCMLLINGCRLHQLNTQICQLSVSWQPKLQGKRRGFLSLRLSLIICHSVILISLHFTLHISKVQRPLLSLLHADLLMSDGQSRDVTFLLTETINHDRPVRLVSV
jgi:hypothetical protein